MGERWVVSLPHEDIAREHLSASQKESSRQEQNELTSWSWTSQPAGQWEINLFKPPIDGIFVTAANTDMEGEKKGEAKMFLPISLYPCGASGCAHSVSPVPARQWGRLIVFNFLAMTWPMDFVNTASSLWPTIQAKDVSSFLMLLNSGVSSLSHLAS